MKIREAFCTTDQVDMDHTVVIDNNGDFVLTCENGHLFKIPGNLTKVEVDDVIAAHKKENEGKVTLAMLQTINEEKLKNI